jgi:MFS family permease
MGTWMQRTAQQWLVYTLTNSPFKLGLLGVCQFGPMLLFSLFAGVFVDKFPKKKVLIFTQTILMLQAFILAALVFTNTVRYWHVFILAAVLGLTNTLDMPTRQSFFVELVGREHLMNAIALNSTIVNIARIIGPAVSGVIMVKAGTAFCFLLNGLSFIAVLSGLFMIKPETVNIRKKRGNIFKDIGDGLKYILNNDKLLKAALLMLIVGTFAMNNDVMIPVFAREVLHKQAGGYSLLLSTAGAGSLIGALLVVTKSRRGPKIKVLILSSICTSVLLMSLLLVHNYFATAVLIAGTGFFNIIFLTTTNSTMQLNSDDEYRGRVMSVYTLVNAGTTPFGNFFAGTVTENLGAGMGFFMCGFVTIIMVLGSVFIKRRKSVI